MASRCLPALIETHRPFDVLVIMLGTNDLKTRFSLPAVDIAAGAGLLVGMARAIPTLKDKAPHEIVLVAPPPIVRTGLPRRHVRWRLREVEGARQALYGAVAKRLGVHFVDAGTVVTSSDVEGIHWDADQHVVFGKHMAGVLRAI